MGDSTTTTKVELPEMSDEEKKNRATFDAAIQTYADSQGYAIDTIPTTKFKNQAKVDSLQSTVDTLTDEVNQLEGELKAGAGSGQYNIIRNNLDTKKNQLNKTMSQLADEQENVTTDYDVKVTKKEDLRVQNLIDQGKTAEADALRNELKAGEMSLLDKKDKITADFYTSVESYYKENPDETKKRLWADIEPYFAEIKTSIGETKAVELAGLVKEREEIEATKTGIFDKLKELGGRIKQTGLEVGEAFTEMVATAKNNGIDLNAALDKTIATSRALAENNMFNQTRETRRLLNEKTVALGRPSTDPRFIKEMDSRLRDSMTTMELNLASQAAQGKLAITEKTGDALLNIANLRTEFAKSQGAKLENIIVSEAGIMEQSGLRKEGIAARETGAGEKAGLRLEDVARARATMEENLGARQEQQRLTMAQGLPYQQLQAGELQKQAFQGQGLAQTGSMAFGQQQLDANLRMAQPTTTTTQSSSFLSGLFSAIGVGAQGAGSVLTGVGSLRG